MAGTKELREVLDFALKTAETADKVLQDGFQFTDLFAFISPLMKLPAALGNIDDVEKELENLDDEERAQLITWVRANYDIADDQAEEMVEHGVSVGVGLGKLMVMFKNRPRK